MCVCVCVCMQPMMKDCYFEINAVGLRSLVPYNLSRITNPIIEFDTGVCVLCVCMCVCMYVDVYL